MGSGVSDQAMNRVSRPPYCRVEGKVSISGVRGTGWHEDGHRIILIGIATNPSHQEDNGGEEQHGPLELLRKPGMYGDVDILREALQVLVEGIMDVEVSAPIGAQRGERNPDRLTHRNGYRNRTWDTRVGTMELRIPKIREGSYSPSLLEPRRRSEKALLAVIQQAYVEGVSTRRVDDLVKALGCDGISKSQVPRICRDLDEVVEKFLGRPLDGRPYHYVCWTP